MRKLAQDIIKAQKGEIEQMNKWLTVINNEHWSVVLRTLLGYPRTRKYIALNN